MPPALFCKDVEIQLMTAYEEVWALESSSNCRSAEKDTLVAEKMSIIWERKGEMQLPQET